MSDEHKQYATTIAATLEAHIIDSRLPKSETEWWAHREILRLRAENEKLREENDAWRMDGASCSEEVKRLRAENEKLQAKLDKMLDCSKAYDAMAKLCSETEWTLKEETEKLRAAMHDIYEVYAGSEGFIPQTCPEAYLQERVKEMADIAAKHKRATALKETGGE